MNEDEREAMRRELQRELQHMLGQKKAKEAVQRKQQRRQREQKKHDEWQRRLTEPERRKKAEFGERATARNPGEARLLAHINGDIAHDREKRALRQFKIEPVLRRWLDQNLGFAPGATSLTAASKRLRTQGAFLMAKKFRKFYRANPHLNFFFVTMCNDAWHTSDRETVVDLKAVRRGVHNVLRKHDLNHIGVIEFDAVTNYPAKGKGCWIMPHLHMIVWCARDVATKELEEELGSTSQLKSEWGAPTVVVSAKLTDENLIHKSYYMFEQPYKAKRLALNPKTGVGKLRTVQSWVPPHLTLRISEILAHCTLKDLIVASGEGVYFKGSLVKALRRYQEKVGLGARPVDLSPLDAFRQLRSVTRRGFQRSPVNIIR